MNGVHGAAFPCRRLARLGVALLLLVATSAQAAWFRRDPPRPGRTTLSAPVVELPAQLVGNTLVIDAPDGKREPFHFLIDTGASVTLVSPSFAQRFATTEGGTRQSPSGNVSVRSAGGEVTALQATNLRRLDLGEARFDNIPALVYDCSALSVHLGVRIDGILGFPLFRETLLTLDYLHDKVRLAEPKGAAALIPGVTVPFTSEHRTPFIALRLGDRSVIALIDSGSDANLSLNPLGLPITYASPPRAGGLVATLTGDRMQNIARINETFLLGEVQLVRPVVDITDNFSALGAGVLRQFCITFDQERSQVTFYRPQRDSIRFPPRRSCGLSFTRVGAYWRVASIIPDSPAANMRVEPGDLVTRINQEPVERWGPGRWEDLLAKADDVTFAFLVGKREIELKVPLIDLVR